MINVGMKYFILLNSGKWAHVNQWTNLSANDEAIRRVDDLSELEGILEMKKVGWYLSDN